MNIGDKVVWLAKVKHQKPQYRVPGVIVKTREDKVKIRIKKTSGEYEEKWVPKKYITTPSETY